MTKFSPPRLIGVASCLVLYTFKNKDETSADRFIVPILWLTNIGACPMLVQDIKLIVQPTEGKAIELMPVHSVPMEAVNSANTFSDFEPLRLGLSPFGGFAVLPGERWINNFAFELSSEDFDRLHESGVLSIAVKPIGKTRFKTVLERRFSLVNHEFSWLKWLGSGGPSVDYLYPTDQGGRKYFDA